MKQKTFADLREKQIFQCPQTQHTFMKMNPHEASHMKAEEGRGLKPFSETTPVKLVIG